MWQSFSQTFPPSPKFTVEDIPDLQGKVAIVTGGNTGIGKEIVRHLLNHNARVYLTARDAEKGRNAIEELKNDTGKEAQLLHMDLASLSSVRKAAEEFLSKEKDLHALFNNAGVMFLTSSANALDLSQDGYDIQWGTNVVGPFFFTHLLTPALLAGAQSSPDKKARVTFTASIVQTTSINWDSLTDTPARKKVSAKDRYGQSKFANVVLATEFARRFGDKDIIVFSLDPGGNKTELQRHMPGVVRSLLSPMLKHPVMGATTSLWGVTGPESTELGGKFLIPWGRVGTPSPASQDTELGKKLWSYLEEQIKGK